MLFIAHRGFRVHVPENSLKAFACAAARGMDYAELDVQLSREGTPYVLHDATLARTAGEPGTLAELRDSEVTRVRLSDGESPVPQLRDVLAWARVARPTVDLMIELKGPGTAAPVCALVQEFGVASCVAFSSRHIPLLRQAHECLPRVPLCLNITKCREFDPDDLLECPPGGLPLPFAHISLRNVYADEEFVAACHRHGVAALAWDFIDEGDPVARIRELVAQGFDGILFDDPTTVDPIRNWQRPFDAERGRP